MADRDAHLTDPDVPRRPGRAAARPGPRRASSPRGSTRDRAAPPAAGDEPARRRDDLPRGRRRRRERRQPDRVELPGLRVGRRRPGDRDPLPEPGQRTSASTTTTRTSSRRASGRSTRCSPGCCSGTASRPVGRRRLDGRRRPAADPRPARVGAGRRRRRRRDRGRRAALVRRAGRALRAAGRGPPRAALRAGRRRGARRARPPGLARPRRSTATSATSTRSSSSTAGRPRPTARSRRRPTRAATGCRRSGEPSGSGGRACAILAPPVAGCAHTTPPPVLAVRARSAEGLVTSNVGQNYPYTSETEADRAARDRVARRGARGLAAKLAAETTPLDANERWWVWKCPTQGCPGLLHVAGYAAEKHAVYVVCDGTCGEDLPALTRPVADRAPRAPSADRAAAGSPRAAAGSASTRSDRARRRASASSTGCRRARPASRRSRRWR